MGDVDAQPQGKEQQNPDSIGTWTITQLTKFIRDIFDRQPPRFLPAVEVEDLTVTSALTIADKATFTIKYHKVGGTGEVGFQNAWVNFAGGWAEATFWRDPFGIVHLRGLVKSGTVAANTPIFTFPPGFRPEVNEAFAVISNGAIGRLEILTDGTVSLAAGSNVYASLSGITFKAK